MFSISWDVILLIYSCVTDRTELIGGGSIWGAGTKFVVLVLPAAFVLDPTVPCVWFAVPVDLEKKRW